MHAVSSFSSEKEATTGDTVVHARTRRLLIRQRASSLLSREYWATMHLAKNIELLTLLAAAQVASGNHAGEISGGNCVSCASDEICHGEELGGGLFQGRNCEK